MERSLSRSYSYTEKDPTSAVNQLHALGPPILLLSSDTTASPAGKRQLPKISLADTSNHLLGVVHTLRVRERHGMPQSKTK